MLEKAYETVLMPCTVLLNGVSWVAETDIR